MPCGPTVTGSKTRTDNGIIDPFSYTQATAMMQSWANMAIFFAAPMRAAMVVADEAVRDTIGERD